MRGCVVGVSSAQNQGSSRACFLVVIVGGHSVAQPSVTERLIKSYLSSPSDAKNSITINIYPTELKDWIERMFGAPGAAKESLRESYTDIYHIANASVVRDIHNYSATGYHEKLVGVTILSQFIPGRFNVAYIYKVVNITLRWQSSFWSYISGPPRVAGMRWQASFRGHFQLRLFKGLASVAMGPDANALPKHDGALGPFGPLFHSTIGGNPISTLMLDHRSTTIPNETASFMNASKKGPTGL